MPGPCPAERSKSPSSSCSLGARWAVVCSRVQLLLLLLQPDHTTTTAFMAIPPDHVAYSSTTTVVRRYPCRFFRGDPSRRSSGGVASPTFGTESTCALWKDRFGAASASGLQAALEVLPADRLEPGCVLWASPENYGHSTFQSVALVYEHGEGRVTKAVAVDKGLEFTLGEMTNAGAGPLSNNRLFRGGEDGGSAVIMIHEHATPGSRPLGDSGLYVGGFQAAMALVSSGEAQAKDFKFFFNYMTWSDGTVEEQVRNGQWKLLKLPKEVLLDDRRTTDMELWGRVKRVMEKEWKQ